MLTHCSSYDLPVDVFEAGDVRPTRPKKKVVKVEPTAKKRSFDTSEMEVCNAVNLLYRKRHDLWISPTQDMVPIVPHE